MSGSMVAVALRAVSLLALAAASGSCSLPRLQWSQRVSFNGRTFVFARIDSLREAPGGDRVDYRRGDFTIEGKGPISVNGFEIDVAGGVVQLANERVDLAPGDEVHFASDMSWTVRPARGRPAAAARR